MSSAAPMGNRIVTYEACDQMSGMSPAELRDALRRAVLVERVRITFKGKIRSITVHEPTDPQVRIGIDPAEGTTA